MEMQKYAAENTEHYMLCICSECFYCILSTDVIRLHPVVSKLFTPHILLQQFHLMYQQNALTVHDLMVITLIQHVLA